MRELRALPIWMVLLLAACPAPEAEPEAPDEGPPPADARVPDQPALEDSSPRSDRASADSPPPLPAPWTKQLGTSSPDHARAVAMDAAGNVYVAGFTPGAFSGASAGLDDVLLVKLGPDGAQLWARQLGSKERDMALAMAVDSQGQVYLTGSTTGGLQGANAGNDGTCKGAASCPDLFVVKLGSGGAPLWTRQLGTTGDDTANGIALDATGVYVTGKTAGGLDGHKSAGWNDVFLIKYSLDGAKLWSQQFGSYSYDEGRAVAADGKGGLLVTGYLAPATGNDDVFLSKRSADTGAELWQKTLASPGITNEEGYAVAVDPSGISLCGYTMGALPGNKLTGFSDLFVARFGLDGSLLWVKQLGATQADPSLAAANALFAGGALYVTGFSNGSLGAAGLGSYDAFVLKLGTDGSQSWLKPIGSAADDRGYGIAGNGSRLVLVGDTAGSVDGKPGLGAADIFVKQLEP